jgi:hypothetical protein
MTFQQLASLIPSALVVFYQGLFHPYLQVSMAAYYSCWIYFIFRIPQQSLGSDS